ncbi:MAG: S1 RNA-binding domain-containing protein [Chloroflexi bacterium]|nr:S1 RNA-binding domain-containing protein [Chloroflexota bacterium]
MTNTFFDSDEEYVDFAALLGEYSFEEPERGEIRDGEILEIRSNEIVVDVDAKQDGIVTSKDIEHIPSEVLNRLAVGDVIPVYVINPQDRDGNLVVSINLGLQGQDWDRASDLLESGDLVPCDVVGHNKGGLLVRFGRLEGFVPASHLIDLPTGLSGDERRNNMEDFIGMSLDLKVIEVNQARRRLILSQREAQREQRLANKDRLIEKLAVGDVVKGRVTGIRDFGVFVDLGGADGLIHVSELAWHRVPHPRDVVNLGDELDVYVLELDEDNQRIALSRCRTFPDPWSIVDETYQVGDVVKGRVSNVVDFGAFVVLPDGIEGLLHVTEMADGQLTEPHSYVQRGDNVTIKVVHIEPDRKRIGFTQKGLGITVPGAAPDLHEVEAGENLIEPVPPADDEASSQNAA